MLIGIDGSEHSYKAVLKAIELEKLYKTKVIVFHSVEHHVIPSGIFMAPSYSIPQVYSISDPEFVRIKEVYEKNAQAIIDKAKEIFMEAGLKVETRLIYENDPVSYIKKMVKEEDVDLVIIGSKGTHSLLNEILLGSVAEKVLRHVPCDIFIVR
ncbi:MAG: universal stress protein [Candidatus Hermodarchaeota archaeon]